MKYILILSFPTDLNPSSEFPNPEQLHWKPSVITSLNIFYFYTCEYKYGML